MSKRKGRGTRPKPAPAAYTIRCYSVSEVSALTGVSERVLLTWARVGSIPYPFGNGKAALWTADDVVTIRCGIALPGTYLVARHPMVRERVEQLRAAARAHRQNRGTAPQPAHHRASNRMSKGGVS